LKSYLELSSDQITVHKIESFLDDVGWQKVDSAWSGLAYQMDRTAYLQSP